VCVHRKKQSKNRGSKRGIKLICYVLKKTIVSISVGLQTGKGSTVKVRVPREGANIRVLILREGVDEQVRVFQKQVRAWAIQDGASQSVDS
jgi:hypothetical protein